MVQTFVHASAMSIKPIFLKRYYDSDDILKFKKYPVMFVYLDLKNTKLIHSFLWHSFSTP